MSNITKHDAGLPSMQMSEADLMQVLQSSLYPGAAPASIKMVLAYCKAAGLDPMQKPVHIVPMWDAKAQQTRDVVMPGVGLYRTQAARTGCAGVTEPEFGPDVTENLGGQTITYPAWCRVTVKRRLATGEVVDFTAKELWKENYAVKGGKEKSIAPNAMWTKRPYGQIAKCAEAQALRKAFPEIGSEPTADEMAGKAINDDFAVDQSTGEITPPPKPTRAEIGLYPQDRFEANLPKWRALVESGQQTPASIEAMISSKARLSDEQRRIIAGLGVIDVPASEPESEVDQFIKDME